MINQIKAYILKVKCDYYASKMNSYRSEAVVLKARCNSANINADHYEEQLEITWNKLKEMAGA